MKTSANESSDFMQFAFRSAIAPDAEFRRSPIHGMGSFALRKIQPGELIVIPDSNTEQFWLNHSCFPNSIRARGRMGLIASRTIYPDDEITEHYGMLPLFDQRIPTMPFPVPELGWNIYWKIVGGMEIR